MAIEIEFAGYLSQKAGENRRSFDGIKNIEELKSTLYHNFPFLKDCSFTIFINDKLATNNETIHAGDKIHLMPLFFGG